MAEYIVGFSKRKTDGEVYKTITSTGLRVITLDAPITSDYLDALRDGRDLSGYADQDNDGLFDPEELRYFIGKKQVINWDNTGKVKLLTFKECQEILASETYIELALSQYSGWNTDFLNDWMILPINSDPTDSDSDNDYADDAVEKEIGTDPFCKDTDGDKLEDGREIYLMYDPTSANADGDIYDDLSEFILGFEPNSYDEDLGDWGCQFLEGFVKGDFIKDKTVPNILGQVAASLLPYVGQAADVRDIVAALISGSKFDLYTNILGAFPGQGDLQKAGTEVGKFITKHVDDFPKVAKVIEKVTLKSPKVVKYIDAKAVNKAADGLKNCTKLTKRSVVQLEKTCKNAGKVVEYNKELDKALKLSQKVLDFSEKEEEFFDARDKDSESGDGDDDSDDDGDDEEDDPLKAAIKESKHYEGKINDVGNPYTIAYSSELIAAFFDFRTDLENAGDTHENATKKAVSIVDETSLASDKLIDNFNHCDKIHSALDAYYTYRGDFGLIIEKYGNEANDAIIAVSDKYKKDAIYAIKNGGDVYGAEAVQAIIKCDDKAVEALTKVPCKECADFIINYGENAAEIGSMSIEPVLNIILKYQEPAMSNLIQGITVDTSKITKLLNEAAENDTDKCKELIALITERPEETPNDLLDVFSHEYIDGVFMYLDNLSLLPDNMDTVWELTPTERGIKIENYYASTDYNTWFHIGAEDNGYFPIIDFQKGDEVISMKSLDPRLKSYQDINYLNKTIQKYTNALAYKEILIGGEKCTNKTLHIVIPEGTMSTELENICKTIADNKINIILEELRS